MEQVKIKDLKKGDYFRLRDTENSPLWVRGEYIRECKKYSTYKYDDVNHERLIKGDKIVYNS
jgi:hypothetical protein